LLTNYPHLKICALGAGACLLAPLINLEVKLQALKEVNKLSYLGRRQLDMK